MERRELLRTVSRNVNLQGCHPWKTKLRSTIGPRNPTSGHIAKGAEIDMLIMIYGRKVGQSGQESVAMSEKRAAGEKQVLCRAGERKSPHEVSRACRRAAERRWGSMDKTKTVKDGWGYKWKPDRKVNKSRSQESMPTYRQQPCRFGADTRKLEEADASRSPQSDSIWPKAIGQSAEPGSYEGRQSWMEFYGFLISHSEI